MQIIELLTPAYEAAWLPWAVQYFFLAGVATGAALLGAACAFAPQGSRLARLTPVVIFTLAIAAIAAPVSLLADLHQPGRFWHFYAHFTPWSWMSIGSLLLPAFVTLSLALCASWWLGRSGWMRLIAPLLVLSALTIVVYTGAEVMVVRARPLWNTAWLPINLALTGWLAAAGVMFIVERFLPPALRPQDDALQLLRTVALALAGALALATVSWAALGMATGAPSVMAAARLWGDFPVWRWGMVLSALGGIAVLAVLLAGRTRIACPYYRIVLGLLLAGSAWAFRWALFMSVQGVPKFGAGLYLYTMPLGGDGLLGIVGVAGLCVALVALASWALELFPARQTRPATV
ncbi:NrfD/PsrC family molybdoenzyme membrane anchor subunit [Oryzisolibacter sp. LB2S]|uniref:NrfD/PsrC family molybdoenzyme membrane anchor subunit n=1 Tax=Alicycliphilus soli TaxID=3228789 RepID=UPI003457941E